MLSRLTKALNKGHSMQNMPQVSNEAKIVEALNRLSQGDSHYAYTVLFKENRFEYNGSLQFKSLEGIDLSFVYFINAKFSGTNFSHSTMIEVSFRESDLSYANFSDADLRNAQLDPVNLSEAQLNRTNLEFAYVIGNLEQASFEYAKMKRALICGNARGANFRHADLSDASFTSANLQDVDFSDAILVNTEFVNCTFNSHTRLPDKTYLESPDQIKQFGAKFGLAEYPNFFNKD